MTATDRNPLVLDVSEIVRNGGTFEERLSQGPAPFRIGPEMIAIEEGSPIEVDARLTNLGEGLMVEATVTGQATGQCVRCLADLHPDVEFTIQEVWALSESFVDVEDDMEEDDLPPLVKDDTVDLTQAVIDEAGVELPFSPVCEEFGQTCDESTPAPDGVSGEQDSAPVDPRWAALMEKFADKE